jgi:S-adenosylmethionine-diacylglycerol 3-amino-3-carboxypropyl transferase
MDALVSSAKWPRDCVRPVPARPVPVVSYGQVWEDADVLLAALDVRPGDVCLSIASAGDNALALLGRSPSRVIAIDRSEAQLFCLELRVAAFRALSHPQLLELFGSRPSADRAALYRTCRRLLSRGARDFWDARPDDITRGMGGAGRFERYLGLFRTTVLPLVHRPATIASLLTAKTAEERHRFYDRAWNTWRWRALFNAFFSRRVMGLLGRRPEYFAHVHGDVAAPILERTRYALTRLSPVENPYAHWILTGTHGVALPYALRPENFETIRANLDRLEWRCETLDDFVQRAAPSSIDRWNLSDVFEYMPAGDYHGALEAMARASRPGGRLVYWNMLARRTRPPSLARSLRPLDALAADLHAQDRAFFYQKLVIEEATGVTAAIGELVD